MSGHSIIDYKGKKISFLDYRGLNTQQMIDTVEIARKKALEDNSPRPLLTNITGAFAVPEFMAKIKEAGKETKHLTTKSAIVGITGAKKILLNVFNLFTKSEMRVFNDEESAKEWLIK